MARRFASSLGYDGVTVYCYADLSARDLLQRRVTTTDGSTVWQHAEPVRAALDGELLVLDNIHRLPPGVLAATLGRLLTDRELQLPDGSRLVAQDRFDELRASGALDDEATAAKLLPVHPAFRVIATAEPPQAWADGGVGGGGAAAAASGGGSSSGSWLGSEMLSLFHFHHVERLDLADHQTLLEHQAAHVAAIAASDGGHALAAATGPSATAVGQLLSLHQVLNEGGMRHGLGLSTRGLLRAARHASLYPKDLVSTVRREVAGRQGALSDGAQLELLEAMRRAGISPPSSAAATVELPPPRREHSADGTEAVVLGSVRIGGVTPPARPELVPDVLFYDSPRHSLTMQAMLKDWAVGAHLLLIGSQGVGKNKLADRMLGLLRREREYMQLHRDVTVAALTQTPTLVNGQLRWEDSPLVRAITTGRVLVVDEADKAPLEVVAVLRSLLSEGRMLLADGRRVVPSGTAPREGLLPIAPGFRAIVLANRPGFPFLGNDFFRECGDVLSCHTVENPDLHSELVMLKKYAPSGAVADSVLRRVAGLFADLRAMAADGRLAYPYSTREAVALVKHMERYADDGVLGAAENVFAFDAHQPHIASQLAGVLRRHGIPAAAGSASFTVELAEEAPLLESEVSERWHAPAPEAGGTTSSVQQVAAQRVPLGQWAAGEATFAVERDEPASPTAALQLGRMRVFSEEVRRWRLPPGLKPQAVAALTTAADGTVHLLTSSFSGLHLFSYSANGLSCSHVALGGRRFGSVGAKTSAGVSLHAMPADVGGGLLLHQPMAAEGRQLLWLHPAGDGDGASRMAPRSVVPTAIPDKAAAPTLADASTVLIRALPLPAALSSSDEAAVAAADSPPFALSAGGFLDGFARSSTTSSADAPHATTSVLLGCAPGHADALHLVSTTKQGGLVLGRLSTRLEPPRAGATADGDGGAEAEGGQGIAGAEGTDAADGGVGADRAASIALDQAEMALPSGLAGPLTLQPISRDSSLLLGSDGMHAALVQWLSQPSQPPEQSPQPSVRVLPLRREPTAAGTLDALTSASVLMGGSLGLTGGAAHIGACLDIDPLLRGKGDAFAFAHRRPAAEPLPTASGWSPAPDIDGQPSSSPAANDVGSAGSGDDERDPLADLRFHAMVEQIQKTDGGLGTGSTLTATASLAPLASPPHSSPVLIHALPVGSSGAEEPPSLRLVDLAAGTMRALPLLPAPPASGADEEDDEAEARGSYGSFGGLGQQASSQVMEALLVAPVPSSAGGGAVTLHRGGELILWHVARRSLEQGLAEWRAIVGWAGGERGGAGDGGAVGSLDASSLSIIQNFPSPKAAEKPKHGKVDETGAPHVGGNTWAGGTGGHAARLELAHHPLPLDPAPSTAHPCPIFSTPALGFDSLRRSRDTAGLGGKGGPYRLSDGNPIHQISDEEKANVSPEALKTAREMAAEAYQERLKEIDMSEHEATMYEGLYKAIRKEVQQLRVLLQSREARAIERVWLHRQSHGELDESRLVDGVAGERAVYRRRAEQPPEQGAPQLKPKLIRFVLDLSGSMYVRHSQRTACRVSVSTSRRPLSTPRPPRTGTTSTATTAGSSAACRRPSFCSRPSRASTTATATRWSATLATRRRSRSSSTASRRPTRRSASNSCSEWRCTRSFATRATTRSRRRTPRSTNARAGCTKPTRPSSSC